MTTDMRDDDLIRDILARVMAVSEDFSQAQALQIEEQVRHDWGGERVFVAKVHHNPKGARHSEQVKMAITTEVEQGMPTRDIERKHGVGRATIYRLLKRS